MRPSIPEGGRTIAAIVAGMGLCVSWKRWSEPDADVARYYVYVYRKGDSCLRRNVGNLSELATLAEEEIKAKIAVLFPRSAKP